MNSLRRWRVTLCAAAWLCGAAASAQTSPVEVVCDEGCRELRVRGDRTGGFRVRVEPGAVVVTTAGSLPRTVQSVRLSTSDGVAWRVAVSQTTAPPPVPVERVRSPLVRPRAPVEAPPPSPLQRRRERLTLLGSVSMALAAAGVFAGVAMMFRRDQLVTSFNSTCYLVAGGAGTDPPCVAFYDDAWLAHGGMIASFALGGAFLAAGVTAFVLRPRPSDAPRAMAWVTAGPVPLGLGVAGMF